MSNIMGNCVENSGWLASGLMPPAASYMCTEGRLTPTKGVCALRSQDLCLTQPVLARLPLLGTIYLGGCQLQQVRTLPAAF
jgi:hypothetical protein